MTFEFQRVCGGGPPSKLYAIDSGRNYKDVSLRRRVVTCRRTEREREKRGREEVVKQGGGTEWCHVLWTIADGRTGGNAGVWIGEIGSWQQQQQQQPAVCRRLLDDAAASD